MLAILRIRAIFGQRQRPEMGFGEKDLRQSSLAC